MQLRIWLGHGPVREAVSRCTFAEGRHGFTRSRPQTNTRSCEPPNVGPRQFAYVLIFILTRITFRCVHIICQSCMVCRPGTGTWIAHRHGRRQESPCRAFQWSEPFPNMPYRQRRQPIEGQIVLQPSTSYALDFASHSPSSTARQGIREPLQEC